MLSPIRSASSSVSALSSAGSPSAPTRSDLIVDAPQPVAPSDLADLNTPRSVKLDLLLVAIRQRMVQALLDVLATAGEALGLPRREGETDLAYGTRVSSAIQTAAVAELVAVEDELTARGTPLPMKLLAGILQNPTGADAARAVIHLEARKTGDEHLPANRVERIYREEAVAREQDTGQAPQRQAAPAAPAPLERPPNSHPEAGASEKPVPPATLPLVATPDPREAERPALQPQMQGIPAKPVAPAPDAPLPAPVNLAEQDPVASMEGEADPAVPAHWSAIPVLVDAEILSTALSLIEAAQTETSSAAPLRPGPADAGPAADPDRDAAAGAPMPEPRTPNSPQLRMPASGALPAEPAGLARAAAQAAATSAPQRTEPLLEDVYAPVAAPLPPQRLDGLAYVAVPYAFAPDAPEVEQETEMRRDRDAHGEDRPHDGDGEQQPSEPSDREEAEKRAEEDESVIEDGHAAFAYERYLEG